MTEQTDAAEELARMIDSQIDGTIVSRAEHDPNCPGGGPECARLCPVRVQDYGDTTDLAAAILASDWLAAREAAAEARGAQAVLAAVEAVHTASVVMQWMNPLDGPAYQEEEWSCDICGWFPTGEACDTLTAARAAAVAAGAGGEA